MVDECIHRWVGAVIKFNQFFLPVYLTPCIWFWYTVALHIYVCGAMNQTVIHTLLVFGNWIY